MDRYAVCIDVSGPLAMFARPDTGAVPTSYPVPTWSAAKGIFESIALLADGAACITPTRVAVLRRQGDRGGEVRYQRYTTNYGGPLRKGSSVSSGAGMQFFATVLSDVHFRIWGEAVRRVRRPQNNPAHHLKALFDRRLKRGECFRTPSLGWKEFTCSYWGVPRDDFEVDTDLNLVIPSMLVNMWSEAVDGTYAPFFAQDVAVQNGVLVYPQPVMIQEVSHAE